MACHKNKQDKHTNGTYYGTDSVYVSPALTKPLEVHYDILYRICHNASVFRKFEGNFGREGWVVSI